MAVTFLGAVRPPRINVGTLCLAAKTEGQDSEPRRVRSGPEIGGKLHPAINNWHKMGCRSSRLIRALKNNNSVLILSRYSTPLLMTELSGIPSGKQGLCFHCWSHRGKRAVHLGPSLAAEAPADPLGHLMGGFRWGVDVCPLLQQIHAGAASLLQELRRNFHYLFLNYWRISWQGFIHHHQPPKDPSFKSVIEQQGSLQGEGLPWTGSHCCI